MKRALLLSLLALALGAGPARAQIVRGQVVEDVTNTPVEGAMVVVVDVGGHVVRRVLTNATGGFIVQVEAPGEYLLRVDRIGYESLTTGRFDVPPEGSFQRIAVPIQPIKLEGLDIEGSRRCRLRNEQGEATARVWEEARKALEAAAWTLSSGVYRYTLLRFERTLEPTLRTVRTERRRFARSTGQAPYVSAPASELVAQGFVRQNPDRTLTYYAPDAAAFLSNEFLDTHCMALESVRDGLVGLAFQPVRGRRMSDIRGTLWIEAATATLRKLEFTYVNLPPGQDMANAGGEVTFGRLPNGTWIVREWSIRMPHVTTTPDRQRVAVTSYEVQGGVVWRVTDQDGRTIVEAETASVSGTVLDSLGSGPVAGASVRADDGAVAEEHGSLVGVDGELREHRDRLVGVLEDEKILLVHRALNHQLLHAALDEIDDAHRDVPPVARRARPPRESPKDNHVLLGMREGATDARRLVSWPPLRSQMK